jgi:ankyrin repeat protein
VISTRDNIGQTILHTAVDSGNLSAVQSLIELKVAEKLINIQDNQQMTPMHIASINYEIPMYNLLVTLKPDRKLKDEEGKTFLDHLQENDDLLDEDLQKYLKLI